MAAKYKEYIKKMLDDNQEVFEQFQSLHNKYEQNQEIYQEKFNVEGERILEIVREYESRLCANTERGVYNKYSSGLAEKFQIEVRKHFPFIDHVGLKVQQNPHEKPNNFILKKIELG